MTGKRKKSSEVGKMYDFSILRELRKTEGLSINKVSERAAVSSSVISKLERNQCSVELETIYRLGRVFGLNPSDLLSLAESRSAHKKKASFRSSNGFKFSEISYGNIVCLYGSGEKGARTSRPEIHRDDYELCWILGGVVEVSLPHEKLRLREGDAIQFDAMLEHSYQVIEDCSIMIVHIRKDKRF